MENKFVLASSSPRRKRLLSEAGYEFEVVSPDAEEIGVDSDPSGSVARNSLAKNAAARTMRPGSAVLSADTVVWKCGRLLGKPANVLEATEMLAFLSGSEHTVFTGVAVSSPYLEKPLVRVEASQVKFRTLSPEAIAAYIEHVEPFDRAGAYDLSDYGEIVVESVTGSYTNVVGLPMESTRQMLGEVGVWPGTQTACAANFDEDMLCKTAAAAAKNAYAPYSNFPVGAALLASNGRIYTGCNIENASFGLSNCAERTAMFKALSDGARRFSAIAVAGGSKCPAYPCGACRQVLAEFCGGDMPVLCCTLDGTLVETMALASLLPRSFALDACSAMP